MQYGICNLSIVSIRETPAHDASLTSQLLYGDHFKVLEIRKRWSRIRVAYDNFEGWVDNTQYHLTDENIYKILDEKPPVLSADLVDFISDKQDNLTPIPMGCNVNLAPHITHSFEGTIKNKKSAKNALIETAFMYRNTPYLHGGKTPFGIDASGFTQMVYKLNECKLLRKVEQQATQGETFSFIEESNPGDLAFFDNDEGKIIHVGLIMKDNYIIHAYGKVRVDRLDHTGIFNTDTKQHTHKLRVMKKII